MTKKNTQFSWRQARDEELGGDDNISLERGENSGNHNNRRNSVISEVNSTPQINNISPNAARIDRLQLGYTKMEGQNPRSLANEELYLAPNEHPSMNLTSDLFDGNNFHGWCRSIKRGLMSRNKLRIVDGSLPKPQRDSVDFMQWLRVDYIVFNWICNSMIKEIARGFQNLETSFQLWEELQRQFGKRNGPRIYKLRREIATYSQHSQSVMIYFNNLTALWDDLALLKNSRACNCEAHEDIKADLEEEHLMQFLMGLDDCYETIRQQILIMNPLPSLSHAYSMILQVEEQIKVSNQLTEGVEHNALYNLQKGSYKGDNFKRRLTKEEKSKLKCDHCGGMGHLKAYCFDLVGIPYWYRKYKADRSKRKAHCVLQNEEDSYSLDNDHPKTGKMGDYDKDLL